MAFTGTWLALEHKNTKAASGFSINKAAILRGRASQVVIYPWNNLPPLIIYSNFQTKSMVNTFWQQIPIRYFYFYFSLPISPSNLREVLIFRNLSGILLITPNVTIYSSLVTPTFLIYCRTRGSWQGDCHLVYSNWRKKRLGPNTLQFLWLYPLLQFVFKNEFHLEDRLKICEPLGKGHHTVHKFECRGFFTADFTRLFM